MNTNFITPPDYVLDERHSVLVIDIDDYDAEALSIVCANHSHAFNVYFYHEDMLAEDWLLKAASQVDTIIVNGCINSISETKNRLAALPKSRIYNYDSGFDEPGKYCRPVEYFINYK